MRRPLALFLFLAILMPIHAETFVYVSQSPEKVIQLFRMNPQDGSLTPVESLPVAGSPGSLAVDRAQKYLFASLRSTSQLASYAIEPATGKLKQLSLVALPEGENAAFVGTDRTGQWLLSASYSAGKVVVHRLGRDGVIQSPPVQTVTTTRTAHCIATDPGNDFVFVPHVAPNAVFQFRWDGATGQLSEVKQVPGGAEGAGPRHLAFHPQAERRLAFTSNESGSSITAYRFDPRQGLSPVQTVSTLPDDFPGKNTTADVQVHPNGRFVWVSNRGHDSLAGFAIDDDGKLTSIGQTPTEKTPRSFEIEPGGRYLLSAGEGSGKLAVYEISPNDGRLNRIHTYDVGQSLSWVMAIELQNAE